MNYFKLIVLALFMMLPGMMMAQEEGEETEPAIAYGYQNTIEVAMGTGRNLKSYPQLVDKGIGSFGHGEWGFNINMRYSGFFSKHWGAYVQLDALSLGTYASQLEGPLSKHYNKGGKEVRVPDCFICGFGSDYGSSYGSYTLGVVYRYDVGHWSFRPRLGVGLFKQHYASSEFYVIDTNTMKDVDVVTQSIETSKGKLPSSKAFSYTPSMQVTFSPRRHFFFSAEVQWTGTIGHLYQRMVTEHYVAWEPQDWPDELDYIGIYCDGYDYAGKTADHRTRVQMGNFLQLRLGVGWNIGHNQNAKRRR